MNVKLLRKIKKHILEEPRRFLMRTFMVRKSEVVGKTFNGDSYQRIPFAKCGTAACIGGWAVLLSDGMDAPIDCVRERANQLLGLSPNDMHNEVYEVNYWPEEFSSAYREAKTQRARATVAAKFIDYLTKKGA